MSNPPTVGEGPEALGSSSLCEDTHRAADGLVLADLSDAVLLEASMKTTAELIEPDEEDYWKRRTLDTIERVRADPTGEEAMNGIRPVRALLRNIAMIAATQQPAGEGEMTPFSALVQTLRLMADTGSWDESTMRRVVELVDQCERDAALSATQQPVSEGVGWQPIETAPKDGTLIWLGRPYSLRVGFWAAGKDKEHHGSVGGGWRDFNEGRDLPFVPTHWQPVPDAPPAPNPIGVEKGAES